MRILVYGLNYAPELTGIGKYTGEMAEWLASRGHQVRVVTAPPYYPDWRIHDGYRKTLYRVERASEDLQPTVYRTPLWVPANPSGLTRMLHLFSFAFGSLPVMLAQSFWRPEVVFTVEPTFFATPVALLAAAMAGAPAWLHIQDFEIDAAFDLGLLPADGPVHALAAGLEQFFTRHFARVSSISLKMLERTLSKGVPETAATLFPNWVDPTAIYPASAHRNLRSASAAPNRFRQQLGLEDKIVLLYSGNMGAKQGLEMLAPLAESFADNPRIHFLFCGDGAFRPQLEAMVAHRPNVTLLPLQPLDRLNDLLNAADIHLLPQRRGAADLVMPSKLTGMLSSGRPIIATADPGTQVAHVVEGCGLVVPAEDPAALHEAVCRLIADPALRASLGAEARNYAVQHLGKEQVLLRFEQELLALTGSVPAKQPKRPEPVSPAPVSPATPVYPNYGRNDEPVYDTLTGEEE
ncbi:MAG TPA: glycosyltransferase WbuB [Granulicella sp.]|nr:glycosyltransferase WbuB [Granulicella sp.]